METIYIDKLTEVGDDLSGKWHIVALAICVSICTRMLSTYALMIAFIIWLLWLFQTERIKQLHGVTVVIFLLFSYMYIPSLTDSPPVQVFEEDNHITGKIIQQLNKKEQIVESVLREERTQEHILLTFFLDEPFQESPIELPYGAICTITGEVSTIDSARNPGQFDFKNYLQSKGISSQLIITNPTEITCGGHSFLHYIHQFRDNIITFIKENIDAFVGSWIQALVFGDTTFMDPEVKEVFQGWGLSHILAISGLHVGLIVGLLYTLFVKTGMMTKETSSYILLVFIPIYIVLAGAQPSVLRAGCMVFLFLLLNIWMKKVAITDGLSIIFIVLIYLDPYIVYHIGFQFSFLTTVALLLSGKWLSQTSSPFWNVAQISLVAQISILPLQLHTFHLFQPLSILLNIVVVTYFSIVVIPFLFLYILLFPFIPSIVQLFDGLFMAVHTRVLDFIFYIDYIDFPRIVVGSSPLVLSIIYYVFLFIMMIYLERKLLVRSFVAAVLLVSVLCTMQVFPYMSKEGRVTMLDIGQGDAIVVELPYRKGVFMIDAGATFSFINQEVSEKEYTHIIKPYLHARGIQKIDALIISHEHLDHNGSAPFIIKDFRVDHYVVSHFYEMNDEEKQLMHAYDIELHRMQTYDEFILNGQQFIVVSPGEDYLDENENSLAVLTELGGLNWLFTGDIYKRQELFIKRDFPNQPIDIWKVAHHGSDTSSSSEVIHHYSPKVYLVPVGVNNSHGHPSMDVIEMFSQTDGTIFRTDQHGAIEFIFTDDKGTFSHFLHTIP